MSGETPGQAVYRAYHAAVADVLLPPWDELTSAEHRAWEAAAQAERERIAGLLDEAAKAIMQAGISLVSDRNEADGIPKVKIASSVSLAASLVRGKVPQQVSDLLPSGLLPDTEP